MDDELVDEEQVDENRTSADVDAWRMHCSRHQSGDAPLAAKLVQIMHAAKQCMDIQENGGPRAARPAHLDRVRRLSRRGSLLEQFVLAVGEHLPSLQH